MIIPSEDRMSVRRTTSLVTGPNGRQVELAELLKTPEKWKVAIGQLIEETKPISPDGH
jgi:hypothetical protein